MKNSADQGGCYPQRPKSEVDNTLRDLQNSSYPTKAEFNNCFIIHSKYFLLLKGVSPLRSLFFRSPNTTQHCPQVFSVNGSIICGWLYFWRHWFNMVKILSKSGEQQLVMVNYACGLKRLFVHLNPRFLPTSCADHYLKRRPNEGGAGMRLK